MPRSLPNSLSDARFPLCHLAHRKSRCGQPGVSRSDHARNVQRSADQENHRYQDKRGRPGIYTDSVSRSRRANRKLEERLHLCDEATLILSNRNIDGRIVAFQGDVHSGYEITIETKKSGS